MRTPTPATHSRGHQLPPQIQVGLVIIPLNYSLFYVVDLIEFGGKSEHRKKLGTSIVDRKLRLNFTRLVCTQYDQLTRQLIKAQLSSTFRHSPAERACVAFKKVFSGFCKVRHGFSHAWVPLDIPTAHSKTSASRRLMIVVDEVGPGFRNIYKPRLSR